jgi:hypothetical protein
MQLSTEGSSSLKIHLFFSFQIHQLMVMIISMTKGTPKARLMYRVALSALSQVGTKMPIYRQQFLQKNISRIGASGSLLSAVNTFHMCRTLRPLVLS